MNNEKHENNSKKVRIFDFIDDNEIVVDRFIVIDPSFRVEKCSNIVCNTNLDYINYVNELLKDENIQVTENDITVIKLHKESDLF